MSTSFGRIMLKMIEVQKKKMALANMALSNMSLTQQISKTELMKRRLEDLQELFRP